MKFEFVKLMSKIHDRIMSFAQNFATLKKAYAARFRFRFIKSKAFAEKHSITNIMKFTKSLFGANLSRLDRQPSNKFKYFMLRKWCKSSSRSLIEFSIFEKIFNEVIFFKVHLKYWTTTHYDQLSMIQHLVAGCSRFELERIQPKKVDETNFSRIANVERQSNN